MNKADTILERLKSQPQPTIEQPDELVDNIMNSLPDIGMPKPKRTHRIRIYAAAAVIIGLLCTVGIMLEKKTEVDPTLVAKETEQPTATPIQQPEEPVLAAITPTETKPTTVKAKQAKPVTVSHATMTPIDSLTDIIAHIESSMQGVRDSCYIANVEKLIRVDDRLQRLVNDLILEGMMNTPTAQVALNEPQDNND